MNSPVVQQKTEAGILARLIQTRQDFLPRDAGISRMNELSELARQGALTAGDEAELDSYIHVSNLLSVMQSTARRSLRVPES